MRSTITAIGLGLMVRALLLATGCAGEGEPFPSSTCSPQTCAGCCQGDQCLPGTTETACGLSGAICSDCKLLGGACSLQSLTCTQACTPDCLGKCAGAGDGCGGVCEVNDCNGCCQGTQCLGGRDQTACGGNGAACVDCDAAGGMCIGTTCSGCTPDCAGKCAGAGDGCGGSCAASDCAGCCDGTTCLAGTEAGACGKNGAACADCAASGAPCTAGSCGGSCVPDCAEKCVGATDSCGGTCTTNTCSGCCSSTSCKPGTSDTVCGQGGETCEVCPSDFEGYSWICTNQTCVKDTPVGTTCTGKDGGTTSCSVGGQSGACWNEKCCTGCYDASASLCRTTSNLSDTSCGDDGDACVNCSSLGKTCSSSTATCVTSSTTCPSCKAYETCNTATSKCELDPDSKWQVKVTTLSINCTSSKVWDPTGITATFKKPDPQVILNRGDALLCTAILTPTWWKTLYKMNTCSTTYNEIYNELAGVKKTFKASELMMSWCLGVLDDDMSNTYQNIGRCSFTPTASNLTSGYKYIYTCKNPKDGVDYLNSLKLTFTYSP